MNKQAFIAMKFTNDPWRDKIYLAIRDVLEEAGYECIRADEIRTSGSIVDEECRLLKESDLVVIDSSGDSHSVSYEIGYCHGIGRSDEQTLLLRNNDTLPFNYRHYRHRVYRDTRHLRTLIRQFLGMIEPIQISAYGYVYCFEYSSEAFVGYVLDGAKCVFDSLVDLKFSGRCECFAAERFQFGNIFVIGVMLRPSNKQAKPVKGFWKKLYTQVEIHSKKYFPEIKLMRNGSEPAEKRAMQYSMLPCGAAQFIDGNVDQVLYMNGDDEDSFISLWMKDNATTE